MPGIRAVNRVTFEEREYAGSRSSELRKAIASILSHRVTDAGEHEDFLLSLRDALLSSKEEIALAITEDTGKPVAASRAEISAAYDLLHGDLRRIRAESIDTPGEGVPDGSHPSRDGVSIVSPDRWCPILSFVERVIPSIFSRKLTVVSPDKEAFTAILRLLDRLDPEVKEKAGLVTSLFSARGKTTMLLKNLVVSDILFSGPMDNLTAFRKNKEYPSVAAEFGEGFSVVVTADASLDSCAGTIASLFLDYSRSPFRRPATVLVESGAEEYLKNRLIEEMGKFEVGDPLSGKSAVGNVQDPLRAGEVAAAIASRKNRTLDLLDWRGFEKNIFYPALIGNVQDPKALGDFSNLPVLRMQVIRSIEDAFQQVMQSGNLMFSSVWSADMYLEELARDTLQVSSIFFNTLPLKLPESWTNPLCNQNIVQGPWALLASMMRKKSVVHGS